MNTRFSLAIIGCGLTGTSLLYQFINKIKGHEKKTALLAQKISIIVFERNHYLGPGVPYAHENIFPFHVSNMPAGDMSIVADRPDDFINWISRNTARLKKKYPQVEPFLSDMHFERPGSLCLPRMIMGEYLSDRFESAVTTARQMGIRISVRKRYEVTDIQDLGQALSIKAMDQETKEEPVFFSERVLLSTGHWFNDATQPGYFASPWPAAALLENIPQGSQIAVMGTSLSAIDTVLTLFSDGRFARDRNGHLKYIPDKQSRQVTMYSRRGLLPKVRGRAGIHKNQFFHMAGLRDLMDQKEGSLHLADVFFLLNKELETAYGRKINWKEVLTPLQTPFLTLTRDIELAQKGDNPDGDVLWQTILFQAINLLKESYSKLSVAQRLWFESDFKSVFMTYASVIPLLNAEKIHAFMKSGVLKIKKLQNAYHLETSGEQSGFKLCYKDESGNGCCERYHFVVDARGQSISYRSNPSKLAQNMLSSGLVHIEEYDIPPGKKSDKNLPLKPGRIETGGLWIDPVTHQTINKHPASGISCSKKIFAAGMMTRGQIINSSMAYECAIATNQISQYVINELTGDG